MNPSFIFGGHVAEEVALPEVRVKEVAHSALAHVSDRCCRAPKCSKALERTVDATRFIFLRSGVCEFHVRGESMIADSNTVIVCSDKDTFTITHPTEGGDECTVICPSPSLMADLPKDFTAPASGATFALSTPRTRLLLRALYGVRRDPLFVDEIIIDLFSELRSAFGAPQSLAATLRSKAHKSEREAIEAVRSIIALAPEANHTLEELSELVHVSPYHLARRFHALTSTSVHRYRLSVRLALALEKLADGCDNLSELAQCLGFTSHSHLSDIFKRGYGETPSRVRDLIADGDAAGLRALLPPERRFVAA